GYVVKEDRDGKERQYIVLQIADNKVIEEVKTEMTGAERSKMFPTDIGVLVKDFLVEHFHDIIDYNFTGKVEKEFDEIAHGSKEWTAMLNNFYGPFHQGIQDTLEHADRASHERQLGTDPVSGKPVSVRVGRFGPLVQIGSADDEEKPRFAS